jgi:asparagine synthase (glutamine-hydrolysing)
MYADKLSMAHSLEVRVPYLDREIVEYVERLGAASKVRMGVQKWLHRQVCRDFMPTEIMGRRKKGFGVNVVDEWFREIQPSSFLGRQTDLGLRADAVERLLTQHRTGRVDNHKVLFSLSVIHSLAASDRDRDVAKAPLASG